MALRAPAKSVLTVQPASVANSSFDVACHVTLRLGIIHAMEGLYHASIARSATKADRQVEASE